MHYAPMTDRLKNLGSDKWDLHFRGRQMVAAGEPVIELTIGEPDIAPDTALYDACDRAMRAGRVRYSNGRGEPAMLEALSAKYSRRTGRTFTPENFLCFPGTQTALAIVMLGLVSTGDKVLLPDPYYATYEGVIRATGAEIVPVRLRKENRFHLRAEDLEAAITPGCRVLLLNTPHNPTGAVLSAAEVAAIGEVCRRHDLWIIADEVYEELVFEGSFASPLDIAALEERVVVTASISKSHAAPGFRSGWAVGTPELCERILPLSESMLFGGQPFISDMTAYALTHDLPTAALMRTQYARRARLVAELLQDVPGIEPLPPEAGMFILLDVGALGISGHDFAEALLAGHRVSVMPGSSFGAQAERLVRLSLTVPDPLLTEACGRIAACAQGFAGRDTHAATA
ncbi:pyridoxal phosphate-dependent aminotransferase [Rhodobacter lacus]|uniref:aspartate transaminase n=1 Tax=Rhodobacter lacus TaxID=1641972 RepID=A0ABW5AAM1_9RHOB